MEILKQYNKSNNLIGEFIWVLNNSDELVPDINMSVFKMGVRWMCFELGLNISQNEGEGEDGQMLIESRVELNIKYIPFQYLLTQQLLNQHGTHHRQQHVHCLQVVLNTEMHIFYFQPCFHLYFLLFQLYANLLHQIINVVPELYFLLVDKHLLIYLLFLTILYFQYLFSYY